MISTEPNPRRLRATAPPLSVLIFAGGRYADVEGPLAETLQHVFQQGKDLDLHVVIAVEDAAWHSAPLIQTLTSRFPPTRLQLVDSAAGNSPAAAYNAAALVARGTALLHVWPGCRPDLAEALALARKLAEEEHDVVARVRVEDHEIPSDPPTIAKLFYTYVQSALNLFPLCSAVVRRTVLLEHGGFDTNPILQRMFDSEFWLRAASGGRKIALEAGQLDAPRWDWTDFPLRVPSGLSLYMARSYQVRTALPISSPDGRREDGLKAFLNDLPASEVRGYERAARRLTHDVPASAIAQSDPDQPRYKIAVIGGLWEYVHNLLCFYNHFDVLAGSGQLTHIRLLDWHVRPERDLRGVDAVIISRSRHVRTLETLEFCQQHNIASLYMLDDNWFSLAQDWPEHYAHWLAPGQPQYETFLGCLRAADAALIYNPLIAEDARPHVRQIINIPTNIHAAAFAAPIRQPRIAETVEELRRWRSENQGTIIGYAGTLRYRDAAFQALAAVARRRRERTRVLLFGYVTAEQLQLFDGSAVTLPYLPYDDYAAAFGKLQPDILVAPLDDCRTARSKCPNKYLEYSIIGAAGVYSDLPPYTDVVQDGENGLLVDPARAAAWEGAIESLIDDPPARRRMAAAARQHVLQDYETHHVAPQFAKALSQLIRWRRGSTWVPEMKEDVAC